MNYTPYDRALTLRPDETIHENNIVLVICLSHSYVCMYEMIHFNSDQDCSTSSLMRCARFCSVRLRYIIAYCCELNRCINYNLEVPYFHIKHIIEP